MWGEIKGSKRPRTGEVRNGKRSEHERNAERKEHREQSMDYRSRRMINTRERTRTSRVGAGVERSVVVRAKTSAPWRARRTPNGVRWSCVRLGYFDRHRGRFVHREQAVGRRLGPTASGRVGEGSRIEQEPLRATSRVDGGCPMRVCAPRHEQRKKTPPRLCGPLRICGSPGAEGPSPRMAGGRRRGIGRSSISGKR